jgi:hypothetical protein
LASDDTYISLDRLGVVDTEEEDDVLACLEGFGENITVFVLSDPQALEQMSVDGRKRSKERKKKEKKKRNSHLPCIVGHCRR